MDIKKNIILLMFVMWTVMGLQAGEVYSEEDEWQESRSSHFYVYYKNAPEDFVDTVQEAAEEYYQEITDNLGFTRHRGWSFDDRAKIYIYSDKQDYIESARQAHWSSASVMSRSKVIRTYPSAYGFFDTTLPHELGHIIFREFIGMKARIPLWLEEGVAMYQEKAKRWGVNNDVRAALEDQTFIPVPELNHVRLTSGTDRSTVDLFYAEAASLVYYLITEFGQHRFVRFCRKLERGTPFLTALTRTYIRFDDLEDLNRSWVNYLKDGN